jgi:hypothetical protein
VARARRAITNSALIVLLLLGVAHADGSDDFSAQVSAIERAHGEIPDEVYTAGRICEDKLFDPVRALALYDRVLREWPDAKVARAAQSRAARLRAEIAGGFERSAKTYATIVATADHASVDDVIRRTDELSHQTTWAAAPEAALWLAEFMRSHGRDPDSHYEYVISTWPTTREARLAATGRAGAVIERGDFARADALVTALPTTTPEDLAVRDDLITALSRARFRAHLLIACWVAIALVVIALLGSLLEAMLRGGRTWPRAMPPVELWFLGPITIVLVIASYTANQIIGPAVLRIAIAGIALAWLSGSTLDLLRARDRPTRLRSLVHIALCAAGVAAVAYLAIVGTGLVDMLAETVKYGPEN